MTTSNQNTNDPADNDRQVRPPVEAYDPFNRMFREKHQSDEFGEMFEHKIINDSF